MSTILRELEQKYLLPASFGAWPVHLFDTSLYNHKESGLTKNWYYKPKALGTQNQSWRLRGWLTKQKPVQLVIKQGRDPINGRDRLEQTLFTSYTSIEEAETSLLSLDLVACSSKWARLRHQYEVTKAGHAAVICIDDNSGYGPLAEIEANDQVQLDYFAKLLGFTVLSNKRLAEMYADVKANWAMHYNNFCEAKGI